MLNRPFFQKLKLKYLDYAQERHEIIKNSSDALRYSKQAIFALHREDKKTANKLIKKAENIFEKLSKKFKQREKLQYEGAYKAAVEEYIEAKLFYRFLINGKIAIIKRVGDNLEEYLGGLCDFTGELIRRAIKLVAKKQYDEIQKYTETTERIINELNQFDLTKILRTKYDQAVKNLKKLEEILYDISLR